MYKLVIGLKDDSEHETLKSAIKTFMEKVKEQKNLSYQWLDTSCWIEKSGIKAQIPMNFYDCRDYAYDQGWMKDRNWVE